MINPELQGKPHLAEKPHEVPPASSGKESITDIEDLVNNAAPTENDFEKNIKDTLRLGEEIIDFGAGLIGLARDETLLAMRTLPNLMMVWLIMMPIILLTWCSFSVLVSWVAYEASGKMGLSLLIFFLQQVLLLLVCRLLYAKYRLRVTLPHTRAHIENFVRGAKNEFTDPGNAQK